jgi:O-acetylserine/cysteine efflux transporter
LVAVACVAWGGNFFTSKLALREFPPLLFTGLRLALLGLLLVAFVKRPPKGQGWRLIAVGLCNGVLHFAIGFWALRQSVTVASPSIVLQSYVPISALLAWAMLGERLDGRRSVAIAVSFLGVMVLGFDPVVLQTPMALAMMLVSAFFLSLGTVLMRPLKGLDVFSQQGWTAIIAVGPLFGLSLLLEPVGVAMLREASWVAWAGVVYSAVIASLVGHGIFFVLTQRHPVAQVTPWLLISPLLTTLLGIVFLHDQIGPRVWLGTAMVLGGVGVVATRKRVEVAG